MHFLFAIVYTLGLQLGRLIYAFLDSQEIWRSSLLIFTMHRTSPAMCGHSHERRLSRDFNHGVFAQGVSSEKDQLDRIRS